MRLPSQRVLFLVKQRRKIKIINIEVFIKLDAKSIIIIVLVAVIGVLVGMNLKSSPEPLSAAPAMQAPAGDAKLAQTYKEKVVVKKIYDNAKDIQTCYLAYLETKPTLTEGAMDILLKVEEDGSIGSVKVTHDEFKNSTFEDCIVAKLSSYYLAPPPLGINRYISHTLAFKSEATALKEAKENAEKNKPPKMLPVR